MIKEKYNLSPEENQMLNQTFYRTMSLSATVNPEKKQGLGYLYASVPAIKLFHKSKENRIKAYRRHFEIFNTTPTVGSFITGLTASMEKKASESESFDTGSINAVKVALMGPLAGIGDSIFWGSLRVISAGIGLSLALQGSVLGVLLFLLIYNIPSMFVRYYGVFVGYGMGETFINDVSGNGVLGKITKYAGIVGMMVVGAMTCTMVTVQTALELNLNETTFRLQEMFDSIMPNLLPLGLVFLCFKLLNKNIKSHWLIYGLMAFCVLGKYIGLF